MLPVALILLHLAHSTTSPTVIDTVIQNNSSQVAVASALVVPNPRVLVFSKTAGFRHDCIEPAAQQLKKLASERGFTMTHTEDASVFTDQNLQQYDVLCFLCTTGDILDSAQQGVVERFVESGKGWVGIHSASDTEYDWPWYGKMVGAYFKSHPAVQSAKVDILSHAHPATNFLPQSWTHTDEWYNFRSLPDPSINILATVDEKSYQNGGMGDFHPVIWCHEYDGGRAIYCELGHPKEAYAEPNMQEVIYQSILWAAQGRKPEGAVTPTFSKARGFSRVNAVKLDGSALIAEGKGSILFSAAPCEDLASLEEFGDAMVHVEFMVPPHGNSGVYLQGRYELQILDSGSKSASELTSSDCGGVYAAPKNFAGVRPLVQAAAKPGDWQCYDIVFQSPRFDFKGKKVKNAKFVEVRLNGCVVQKDVEVSRPTGGGGEKESSRGPLRLQADHGPMAFRNLWVKPLRQ